MMPRPARPDELPTFGSVWQWGERGFLYVALGSTPGGNIRDQRWEFLVLNEETEPYLSSKYGGSMIWMHNGTVVAGWACVDEGGHSGSHRGSGGTLPNGDPCPRTLHHHHDEKCGD